MKLKRLSLAFSLIAGAYSGMALAESTLSANMALTSDYVWRGTSQTDNGPAIQGGFDFAHGSGFYIGVWGSNVDFKDDANIELDLYGGYSTELSSGIGIDVGAIHYDYPSQSDSNFDEFYLGLSYDFLSAKVSHDADNDNTYWEIGAGFELPQDFGLNLHLGYNDPDAGQEVTDWKLGLTKSFSGIDFELAYTDTDADNNSLADGRGILTISKSF